MIKPLGDKVLVKLDKVKETTKSGLILPGKGKEESTQGVVEDLGSNYEFQLKVGDRVVLPRWVGDDYKDGETIYKLIPEEDILGILT